jgi:hypothetical protein
MTGRRRVAGLCYLWAYQGDTMAAGAKKGDVVKTTSPFRFKPGER